MEQHFGKNSYDDCAQAQKRAMVQRLLSEIYNRYSAEKQFDSSTETSCLSDGIHSLAIDTSSLLKKEQNGKAQLDLHSRNKDELFSIKQELDERISVMSTKLVRQLKQRNRLRDKNKRFCDTITAVLQAVSKKRKEDTKLQFNMEPVDGEEGFNQDLHRTGYSNLSASEPSSEEDRLVLKKVLLAYARFNQDVGYCQGFNVLAALILQVTEKNEKAAFKIMVHLIDGVLPENYFANNLQGLSVDMAVFRDLMKARLPQLSRHLDLLQKEANKASSGSNYEPPLTNVFTMQWFLTLYATCLPMDIVLRIWDSVLLDGSEVLLRIALAIWAKLGEQIGEAQSADDFYCRMSELMQEALNGKLFNGDEIIRLSYRVASFPFPHLKQLREKYTYNITPFAAEQDLKESDYSPDHSERKDGASGDVIEEYDDAPFFCFSGFGSTSLGQPSNQDKRKPVKQSLELANNRLQEPYDVQRGNGMMAERMSTDIAALKNQYMSIRSRQLRAHLVYTKPVPVYHSSNAARPSISPKITPPVMVNHLLIGRKEVKQSPFITSIKQKDSFRQPKKHKSGHKQSKPTLGELKRKGTRSQSANTS